MLGFDGITTTGVAAFDSGIGDLDLKTLNGVSVLCAATGVGGGISAWQVAADGSLTPLDTQMYAGTITAQVSRNIWTVQLDGTDHLVLDVDTATGLVSYDLGATGQIGSQQETQPLTGGGDIDALVQFSTGGHSYVTIAHTDTGQIATYRVGADGAMSLTGARTGRAVELETLAVDGATYVIAADTTTNSIVSYGVLDGTGTLTAPVVSGAAQGLGITAPTAIETVQAYGASWVLVAGSESNSISVMQLGAGGSLTPTDHVLDTLGTRFAKVQDLKLVMAEGADGEQVFVIAGGGDDGLSLFTLTPHGRLVYLDSFADTAQSGLQNVQAIEAHISGSTLHIYVTSQEDAGITRMSAALGVLGQVKQGNGALMGTPANDMLMGGGTATLSGEAGDDILIAGTGVTTMTGGAGQDIFVMQVGGGATTITDFEAGIDRLDLFDYPLLRSPDQLAVTPTGQGAQIRYLNETVTVQSANGGTLSATDLFGAGFVGPDHIPLSNVDDSETGGGSGGVVGTVSVNSATANAALADAEIRFTPTGGAATTVRADAQGQFDFDPGSATAGEIEILKTYSTASAEITAMDALQVLRIAVGMQPTFGAASPENLIAADINQDGTINALDALDVLRAAVGMDSNHPPKWVFLDSDTDLSHITPNAVSYETKIEISVTNGGFSTEMTSILLGNMEA